MRVWIEKLKEKEKNNFVLLYLSIGWDLISAGRGYPYLILNLTIEVNNFFPQCVFVKEIEVRVVLL